MKTGRPATPRFFSALAKALAEKPGGGLELLVTCLVDSMWNHLDGAYLSLQCALEAFAYDLQVKSPHPPLVRSWEEWHEWVDARKDDVLALAANEEAGKRLLKKLRDNLPRKKPARV
jgi:hypothetical protein